MKRSCVIVPLLLLGYFVTSAQENTGVITYAEVARLGRGNVERIAWSPDGQQIAAMTARGIWFYDADSFVDQRLFTPPGVDTAHPDAIVLNPAWTQVAALNTNGGVSVWSVPDGIELY